MAAGQKRNLETEELDENKDWFYGSKPSKVAKLESGQKGNESRRDTLVDMSLGGFDTFPRQKPAMEKLDESKDIFKNYRIFSYEITGGSTGERRYLVTSLSPFWSWYEKSPQRHMYELIHEDHPCRLYFDLEYSKDANSDVDEIQIFDRFTKVLAATLKEVLELDFDPKKGMLVLDSSTDKKFSAHVICHLKKGLLFPSSSSIRPFASILNDRLLENAAQKLWNSEKNKEISIVDLAVYSKNRNFRLYLSSKMGKEKVLDLAKYCTFYDTAFTPPTKRTIFLDSLCVPADFEKYGIVDLSKLAANHHGTSLAVPGCSRVNPKALDEGSGPSPYLQLDEFILMVMRKWKPDVYLRQWKITEKDGKAKTIVYYPGNCRYCFNISRQHKSNGTYWTIDLEKKEFYQKCFDPDCRGVSSNAFPLPKFVADTLVSNDEESRFNTSITSPEEADSFFDITREEARSFFTQWDQVFDS